MRFTSLLEGMKCFDLPVKNDMRHWLQEAHESISDLGELLVSLLYNENLHRLSVTVIEARRLKVSRLYTRAFLEPWTLFRDLLFLLDDCVIQCDSFGTRPKKMRISQRLFIRFWTCIYDYIPCFMWSMSILVCRSLTSWRHRDNDWRLAPCRAQPCHCVVR